MTWEQVPPPKKSQMTDEQAQEHLQTVLDTMTFEEQAEFLRELGGLS